MLPELYAGYLYSITNETVISGISILFANTL